MNRILILVLLTGCFDSLVSDPCAAGFSLQGGHCLARDGQDAGGGPTADGAGGGFADALVCTLPELACEGVCIDVTSDPDHCGACGISCPSGVCVDSACVGALPGHVVAIGHDYRARDGAMARVLGNAIALGAHFDVGIARWHGSPAGGAVSDTTSAIAAAMLQVAHPWHDVTLGTTPASGFAHVDTLVVDAQTGDGDAMEASAAAWSGAFTAFLARGGVVIVLEGRGGISYRFARGAGLYDLGAPVDATGQLLDVVDATDAVTAQVVSPYLGETTTVTLPGATGAVIATATGAPVVMHLVR